MKIDLTFLRSLEGFRLDGYVPVVGGRAHSRSGVTIATGVDLSWTTLDELGLSKGLWDQLKSYTAFRGELAQVHLERCPLKLSQAEADELDFCVLSHNLLKLRAAFNLEAVVKWEQLGWELQTVIYSVYHHYGNLSRRTPKFWKQLTNAQFLLALRNLRNFQDDYPSRRNHEADLFERGIMKIIGGTYEFGN